MVRLARRKKPSRAVAIGAPAGTSVGAMIDIIATLTGHPLPPGAGAVLGGVLATGFAYFTRGGRKGESE